MKTKFLLLIIGGLLLCLYACKKNGNNIGRPSIIGKWNIVSDSTYAGINIYNHLVVYNGRPGDYFSFNINGNCYTKEGAVLDTLGFKLLSDTTISVLWVDGGEFETCRITAFTSRSLVIDAPKLFTPGGIIWRKVTLTR